MKRFETLKTERSTHSLPCQINSLTLIVCLYYVNFVAKISKLELENFGLIQFFAKPS